MPESSSPWGLKIGFFNCKKMTKTISSSKFKLRSITNGWLISRAINFDHDDYSTPTFVCSDEEVIEFIGGDLAKSIPSIKDNNGKVYKEFLISVSDPSYSHDEDRKKKLMTQTIQRMREIADGGVDAEACLADIRKELNRYSNSI